MSAYLYTKPWLLQSGGMNFQNQAQDLPLWRLPLMLLTAYLKQFWSVRLCHPPGCGPAQQGFPCLLQSSGYSLTCQVGRIGFCWFHGDDPPVPDLYLGGDVKFPEILRPQLGENTFRFRKTQKFGGKLKNMQYLLSYLLIEQNKMDCSYLNQYINCISWQI